MSIEGFQFFHIETYARISNKNNTKQSAINVALEADRVADACPHIDSVSKPIRLYGCSASEAVQRAEEIAKNSTDKMGRSVRKDAAIIIAGVASYPLETKDFEYAKKDEKDALKKWLKINHEFLQKKYGDRYVSNILHVDEKYFHIHFYVLPRSTKEGVFDINNAHDGISAKNNLQNKGIKAKENAYKAAMRALQDEYYENVGVPCGLTRDGPKRRRLTRREWQYEKTASQRLADAEKRIEFIKSAVQNLNRKKAKIIAHEQSLYNSRRVKNNYDKNSQYEYTLK